MKHKSPCQKCFHYVEEQTDPQTGTTIFYCRKNHTERFLTQFNPNLCPDYNKDKTKKLLPALLDNYNKAKTETKDTHEKLKLDVTETYITGYYD